MWTISRCDTFVAKQRDTRNISLMKLRELSCISAVPGRSFVRASYNLMGLRSNSIVQATASVTVGGHMQLPSRVSCPLPVTCASHQLICCDVTDARSCDSCQSQVLAPDRARAAK